MSDDSRADDSLVISQKHLEQVHDMVADAMLDLPSEPNTQGLSQSAFGCKLLTTSVLVYFLLDITLCTFICL